MSRHPVWRFPFLYVAVFCEAVALGASSPFFPNLLGTYESDAAKGSWLVGLYYTAYAVTQLFFAPRWGRWSDQRGRKIFLVLALAGQALDYALMTIRPALWLLFLGRLLSGSFAVLSVMTHSYLADHLKARERLKAFGFYGAVYAVGFTLGPLCGGKLFSLHPKAPFLLSTMVTGLGALAVALGLPGCSRTVAQTLKRPFVRSLLPVPGIGLWVSVLMLFMVGDVINWTLWSLFAQTRLGWKPVDVSSSVAWLSIHLVLVQGFLLPFLANLANPRWVLWTGMLATSVAFAGIGFQPSNGLAYALLSLFALSGLVKPAILSLTSLKIPQHLQGGYQGSIQAVLSALNCVSPMIYAALYEVGIPHEGRFWIGLPYFFAASVTLLAFLLSLFSTEKNKP
jgi:MFS transporter, DHA1 family, tetracycline resistance protein